MRNTLLLSIISYLSTLAIGRTTMDQNYLASVCYPSVNATANSTIPPCISVENIREQCKPNGSLPLQLAAHAQCLCNKPSSFFDDWVGCGRCIEAHGGMTSGSRIKGEMILAWASLSLCSSLKTAAVFEDMFSQMSSAWHHVETQISDYQPSATAVSLYWTAHSHPQGPGVITGNATLPVATLGSERVSSTKSLSTSTTTGPTGTITAAAVTSTLDTQSSTPSLKNGALPFANADMGGIMVAAGGALLAIW